MRIKEAAMTKSETHSNVVIAAGICAVLGSIALVIIRARKLGPVSSLRAGAPEGTPLPVPELHP